MKEISEMNRYELDEIEYQIAHRKLEIYAESVKASGLPTRIIEGIEYVLVYSPDISENLNVWADAKECKHLLSFVANLEPAEAFRRWVSHVTEKFPSKPYTQQDAIRDTKEARIQLKQDYADGKIDGRDYADLYRSTSFMDLVK